MTFVDWLIVLLLVALGAIFVGGPVGFYLGARRRKQTEQVLHGLRDSALASAESSSVSLGKKVEAGAEKIYNDIKKKI